MTTLKRNILLVACVLLCGFAMAMGVTGFAHATGKNIDEVEFVMAAGAELRIDDSVQGMRFSGVLTEADYDGLAENYEKVEGGMFIMPKAYISAIGDLNYENTFGESPKYVWGEEYETAKVTIDAKDYYRILHMEAEPIPVGDDYYRVFGSVHGFLAKNLALDYTAAAYLKVTDDKDNVSYKFATVSADTRSMVEVALRAINSGSYDDTEDEEIVTQRAIIDKYVSDYKTYIDNDSPTASYTINYIVTGDEGSGAVSTTVVSGNAMNSDCVVSPTAPAGYVLDTRVETWKDGVHVYVNNKATVDVNLNKTVSTAGDLGYYYKPIGHKGYVVSSNITGGTISGTNQEFKGFLDGDGHIIKDATDSDGFGVLGSLANGATLKDIALVNLTGSSRNMLAYSANDLTIKNAYIGGTCYYHDIFEYAYDGGVTLDYVILNCYCSRDDYMLGKAGESGAGYVTYDHVIQIDEKGAGKNSGSTYDNSKIMSKADFFTTYAASGLGDDWAAAGFTVDSEGLYFHGTKVLANDDGSIKLGSSSDITNSYKPNGSDYYKLTADITGGTITGAGTFTGTLDGQGHVLTNAVDSAGYGILGAAANGATLKDIALVNLTGSARNMLAYETNGLTVENAYIGGTCYYHDLFEYVYGSVTFDYVILDCYCSRDALALGKAGEQGGANVTYNHVIQMDSSFFTTYASGLGDDWAAAGFTIESDGLYFHGTLIKAK